MAAKSGVVIPHRTGDSARGARQGVAVLIGLTVVALLLLGIFRAGAWYAAEVSLPRFCATPADTVARVQDILTKRQPVGNAARRDYIVAAKLIYLEPQRQGEALEGYMARLRRRIEASCG